jgi:uncharacterized membrane protein YGL010W
LIKINESSAADVLSCKLVRFSKRIAGIYYLTPRTTELRMKSFFRRQLAIYADYHRDWRNCLMHIIGNPILFLAAVLPLSLLPVMVFNIQTNLATLLVIPALILWMLFDLTLGLAIVASAIPLLFVAAAIASHASVAWIWTITVALIVVGWTMQIFGHQYFEGRRPALLDNPIHMLISPMYVFAKLFIALGFRPDLAAVLRKSHGPIAYVSPLDASKYRADVGEHP